jgi:GH43 family beta-xylosidase
MIYSKQLWAPEIHFLNGKWYVYFAADDGINLHHRIWVLENSIADPFEGQWLLKGKLTDPGDHCGLLTLPYITSTEGCMLPGRVGNTIIMCSRIFT